VKALNTSSRATYSPARPWPRPTRGDLRVALDRVPPVRVLELFCRDRGLGGSDTSGRLEPVDGQALLTPDEPVAGRHRFPVFEHRSVAEDDRPTFVVKEDHLIRGTRRAAKQQAEALLEATRNYRRASARAGVPRADPRILRARTKGGAWSSFALAAAAQERAAP
jgi:hypothetical protein